MEKKKEWVTYEVVLLNEGDDVQRFEVWEARGKLWKELARRRRIDDENC